MRTPEPVPPSGATTMSSSARVQTSNHHRSAGSHRPPGHRGQGQGHAAAPAPSRGGRGDRSPSPPPRPPPPVVGGPERGDQEANKKKYSLDDLDIKNTLGKLL